MNLIFHTAIILSLCSQYAPKADETINVNSDKSTEDNSTKRKLHFVVEPSYLNMWVDGDRSMGPLALDLGLLYKKNYFGLNYHAISAGGSFQYYYVFYIIKDKDIVSLCPGLSAGFYMAHINEYGWQIFVGGPTIKAKIAFFTVTYGLAFGSKTGHVLKIGLQIVL